MRRSIPFWFPLFRQYICFHSCDRPSCFQQDYRGNNDNDAPLLDMNLVPVYDELKITGRGIRVAIIDDGLEYTHDDLKNNYVRTLKILLMGFRIFSPKIRTNNLIIHIKKQICTVAYTKNKKKKPNLQLKNVKKRAYSYILNLWRLFGTTFKQHKINII